MIRYDVETLQNSITDNCIFAVLKEIMCGVMVSKPFYKKKEYFGTQ